MENKMIYKFSPEVYTKLYNYMVHKEVHTLFLKKYIITEIQTIDGQIIVKIEEIRI